MLYERSGHALVSIGNKMFVISKCLTKKCEVFDRILRKFNFIQPFGTYCFIEGGQNFYCVDRKIVIFFSSSNCFVIYDTVRKEWMLKTLTIEHSF